MSRPVFTLPATSRDEALIIWERNANRRKVIKSLAFEDFEALVNEKGSTHLSVAEKLGARQQNVSRLIKEYFEPWISGRQLEESRGEIGRKDLDRIDLEKEPGLAKLIQEVERHGFFWKRIPSRSALRNKALLINNKKCLIQYCWKTFRPKRSKRDYGRVNIHIIHEDFECLVVLFQVQKDVLINDVYIFPRDKILNLLGDRSFKILYLQTEKSKFVSSDRERILEFRNAWTLLA